MAIRHAAVVAAAMSVLTLVPAATAAARPATTPLSSFDRRLLFDINSAREQHGVPALALSRPLRTIATTWAHHIAAAQRASDNPNLRAEVKASCPQWKAVGEVIAKAGEEDADDLFQAYMKHPGERHQLLARAYTNLGLHSVPTTDKGAIVRWNVIDLARNCP